MVTLAQLSAKRRRKGASRPQQLTAHQTGIVPSAVAQQAADPTPPRLPPPASDPLSFLHSFDDQVQGALDLQQLTEWQQRLQASSAGVAARMLHVIKQGRAGSSHLDEPE